MFWQQYNGFLPDHSSIFIINIVNLVKYDPFDIFYHLGTPVKVIPQYLCCHYQTARLLIHTNIPSDDAYILRSEFLA